MMKEPQLSLIPSVTLVCQRKGIYDFVARADAPNTCYASIGYELALPPGVDITLPSYVHVLLHVDYSGSINRLCHLTVTPLAWRGDDVNLGEGKTHALFHTVVNKTWVAGTTIAALPEEGRAIALAGVLPWPGI